MEECGFPLACSDGLSRYLEYLTHLVDKKLLKGPLRSIKAITHSIERINDTHYVRR